MAIAWFQLQKEHPHLIYWDTTDSHICWYEFSPSAPKHSTGISKAIRFQVMKHSLGSILMINSLCYGQFLVVT